MKIIDRKWQYLFALSRNRWIPRFSMKEILNVIEKANTPSNLVDYVYHPDNITLNIMTNQS